MLRIVPFLALSVAIAAALSLIAELDGTIASEHGGPVTVFSDRSPRMLSEESVVDELSALRLAAKLKRVSLRASVLEVDLLLRHGIPVDEDAVYGDLGKLASLALAEAGNISRVIVRVLEEGGARSGGRLLIALSGAKNEFSSAELKRLRDGEPMPREWLSERMRMTVTDRWEAALARQSR